MSLSYITKETVLTIDHEEVDNSPIISDVENRGFQATRILLVDWDDRIALMDELRGRVVQGPILVERTVPHRFPERPSAICFEVSIEPFGGVRADSTKQNRKYEAAKIKAVYFVPDSVNFPSPDEEPQNVLISESLEPSVEFLTIPKTDMFWDDTPKTAGVTPIEVADVEQPGKQNIQVNWVYTIHQVENFPLDSFDNLGKVNQKDVTSVRLNKTFKKEELLFSGLTTRREITQDGAQAWSVTYTFSWRNLPDSKHVNADPKTGWNLFLRRGDDPPEPLFKKKLKDDGTPEDPVVFLRIKPYGRANFQTLIA